ncbi:MAG TPA: oligosaccharide flippase family protein [Steroidobacteraceae bacterium]|nr:oligosaccharide flippase family protein [Steroidobacteraceae bacterium]
MTDSASAKDLVKHSTIYAIGNVARQLVGFLMLPVYTRYLTPADYGAVGLILFAVSLMEPLLGARLAQAVPKFFYEFDEEGKRKSVISTACTATAVLSALSVLGLVAFRGPLSIVVFGRHDYGTVFALFSTLLFSQAVENYGLMYMRIRRAPVLFVSVNLVKLIVQLSLGIWFVVVLRWGVLGVAVASATSTLLSGVGLAMYTFRHAGLHFDRTLAWKMVGYCWPLWLAGLATLYLFSSNRYYMRLFSSLDEIGLYELAARFAAVIGFLIWEPFMQFWNTERFIYAKHENAADKFNAVFNVMCAGLVMITLGISVFAPDVISVMSSPAFHGAGSSVPFLTLATVFNCLLTFCQFSFLLTGNTKWIWQNNLLVAGIITILNLALIPTLGHVGASLALMFSLAIQFAIVQATSRRYFDMKLSNRTLISSLVIASIAYLLTLLWGSAEHLLLDLSLKVGICIVAAVLIGTVLLSNRSIRERLVELPPAIRLLERFKRA